MGLLRRWPFHAREIQRAGTGKSPRSAAHLRCICLAPIFPGVFAEIAEWRNATLLIAPNGYSVLVGPDLRAGRFLAGTLTLFGRLGDPPLPHSLARMRLAKHIPYADLRFDGYCGLTGPLLGY